MRGLEKTDIRILIPTLEMVKPYLPKSIVSRIDLVFGKPSPTREQLSQISKLGESVGLEKNEIIAAIDAPLSNQGGSSKGDRSKLIPLIIITIIAVCSFLFVWAVVDPESFPIHTYTPGTFYGTIRPQDFSSYSHTPLLS